MKKLIFILMVGSLLLSCAAIKDYQKTFHQQDLSNIAQIRNGMTQEDVLNIIGNPVQSELFNNIEEWQYCNTGAFEDTFVALFFVDDSLAVKYNYKNNSTDGSEGFGSCEKFIKKGNYKTPTNIQKLLDTT